VQVPRLDDAGVDPGEVHLAELLELGVVDAEHVHDLAALVHELAPGRHHHAVDHPGSPPMAAS
jgi:hypothetical protein